jgi:AraC-like DNA-binding protein
MPRHRHASAYAAVVLSGEYVEAGDEGRRRVGPGDVLVHRPFEAHLDRIGPGGAEVLNLELPAGHRLPPSLRVRDPEALVAAAATEPEVTVAMLAEAAAAGAPALDDWPDLLAAALRSGSKLPIAVWAQEQGLAAETVSRGFRLTYGTTPRRYRAEQRARRALGTLLESAEPLSTVAAVCGFADQAHMTRAVASLTGVPPAAWRLARSSRFKTRTSGLR